MKKIIIMSLTLFAFALINGCGWFTGDGDSDGTTDGGATAGEATAGATTGDEPDPKPPEECGDYLASSVEKVMVEEISCARNIPAVDVKKGSYFAVKADLSEEEKQAVIESCGYSNKFAEDTGAVNCKSGNAASQLCFNKSEQWSETLKSQGYFCERAEAVPYSTVLENRGYKKANDKYVKE